MMKKKNASRKKKKEFNNKLNKIEERKIKNKRDSTFIRLIYFIV